MLRKMVGSKRKKETAEWRELREEKLHDLYSSQSIQ
jgi:hypothetical protein